VLGGAESLASFFLAVFSVGIATGSLACARRLRGEITPVPVPFAALAMSALLLVFAALVAAMPAPATMNQGLAAALAHPGVLTSAAVFFLLSAASGFYAVPLYAILQREAPAAMKARMIGANNVVNSVMIVAGAAVLAILSTGLGLSVATLAVLLALLNLVAAAIMLRLLSRLVLKAIARAILTLVYRVEVTGAGELRPGRIAADHRRQPPVLPRWRGPGGLHAGRPVFAVDTEIARRWWARPLLRIVDFAAVDPTRPMGLKSLAKAVETGRPLVIFPEGRLTVHRFAHEDLRRSRDDRRQDGRGPDPRAPRWPPAHAVHASEGPRREAPHTAGPHDRPAAATSQHRCFDQGSDAPQGRRPNALRPHVRDAVRTTDIHETLFGSLIKAVRLNGRRRAIIEDIEFKPMSYGRLLMGSFILGPEAEIRHLARRSRRRAPAELDRRRRHVLRPAGDRPRARHAEPVVRCGPHDLGLSYRRRAHRPVLAQIRRARQVAGSARGHGEIRPCGLPRGCERGKSARSTTPSASCAPSRRTFFAGRPTPMPLR
jgi:acyl-[acyl-carrier-protein]-phospholipid O-acyltransferase/long-chain-fatty-acid--[acyl-carrier-protein] ligase